MAQHNINNDLNWIKKVINVILIRNPKEVILSYIKINTLKDINQLGYIQQFNLAKKIEHDLKHKPIIIDSKDILKNPKYILKLLCKKCNIPFYNEMLSWPKGKRKTDGIWSKYWYSNVENSNKFLPYSNNNIILPKKYENIFNECIKYYLYLYKKRIK